MKNFSAIRGTGVTIMTWGVGEGLEGSSHSHGSGAQVSFSDRSCFPPWFFIRNVLRPFSEKGLINLQTLQSFRKNTGQRKFCDEQPNISGPSVSWRNART